VKTHPRLYLSPEAIKAPDIVDARSDLYGLGAVGYFLESGQHVFSGATMIEVCAHHLNTRPLPPSERLGRQVPAELERLLLGCLEKEPGRRPQSAAERATRTLAIAFAGRTANPE
jgi:serine/threonine-protein kinase